MVLAACTYGSLQVLINNKPINTPLVIILASCGLMAKISIEERMALIKRNSAEIVTEEELLQLLQGKKKPVVYCGYEPSGELHLGHLVTLLKLLDMEKAGFQVKILLADWHAWLNKKGDWKTIHESAKLYEKACRKIGFKNAKFFLGSKFQRKQNYIDDVFMLALHTTINRGLRSMQEVARDVENATISQTLYPLMQIADIKYLGVDVAEAGLEQRKIHMLGRETLELIKYKKPAFVHTPLINSLQGPGQKMSSSVPESFISVRDSAEEIKNKINKAFCPEGIIENNPVLEITKLVVFPKITLLEINRPEKFGGAVSFGSYEALEKAFANRELHPMDLKNAVSEKLAEILEPIRREFKK